ncbi:MAG: hypothetical protein ABEN55_18940, partial [Bradymonadaceae bacterium]
FAPMPDSDDHSFTWQKLAGFAATVVALLAILPLSEPAPSTANSLTAQFAARGQTGTLDSELEKLGFTVD